MTIIKTLKELKKFCRSNKIKCVKDKKSYFDKYILSIPKQIDEVSKSSFTTIHNYDVNEVDNKVVIMLTDTFWKQATNAEITYKFDNSQQQILAVMLFKREFTVFFQSTQTHDDTKIIYADELLGETNNGK